MQSRDMMQIVAKAIRWIVFALSGALALTGASAAPEGSPWGANYFPNVALITHEGKTVRFYDDLIKDKVVAINFIFTSCSQVCPAETAKLRQVQKLLGDRVGRDVFLYSISIAPEHDTPAVLKEYAKKFEVGPGWLFLTGKAEEITALRAKLGLYRGEEEEQSKSDHGTSLMVGNEATGEWFKRSPYDDPQVLASVIGERLHNWKVANAPTGSRRAYLEATRIANLSKGEELFRNRCVTCHSIGGGDGVGPDLLGVTSHRGHDWLTRWLMVPDQMLAEKDPIAMDQYSKFKQLPMPNLGLSEGDARALIEYIKKQTRQAGKS